LLTFGINWSDLSALINLNDLSQISQVLKCDLKVKKYGKSINTKIIKKLSITQSTFNEEKKNIL
jgi:hypothetical protein